MKMAMEFATISDKEMDVGGTDKGEAMESAGEEDKDVDKARDQTLLMKIVMAFVITSMGAEMVKEDGGDAEWQIKDVLE
jgi:hypothetical protein